MPIFEGGYISVFMGTPVDGSMETGAWGGESGDRSMRMGAWRRECRDGSMGTGAWRWEHGDGILGMAWGSKQGTICFWLSFVKKWFLIK